MDNNYFWTLNNVMLCDEGELKQGGYNAG